MNYQDVLENAKKNIGPYCKICPECNGIACRGKIPGPGGKGIGLGFIRNYQDLKKIKLNLDTIYHPEEVSTKVTLFNKDFSLPVFAAPIGAVAMHYSNAYDDLSYSKAVLDGCIKAGTVGFTGDGVKDEVYDNCVQAIQDVGGLGVPTIKPWNEKDVIIKAKKAKDAGAFAFAMDIDAAGLAILAMQGRPVAPMPVDSLKKISSSVDIPFILKGIMTKEGAQKAYEAGAKGIVVSNHGGRVLDETPSSIEVLPEIVKEVKGKMTILIDGGVRTGLDVFKALAMGADGVLIGRPFTYAVYGGKDEGVFLYLEKVRKELEEAMIMTGAKTLSEITLNKIRR